VAITIDVVVIIIDAAAFATGAAIITIKPVALAIGAAALTIEAEIYYNRCRDSCNRGGNHFNRGGGSCN